MEGNDTCTKRLHVQKFQGNFIGVLKEKIRCPLRPSWLSQNPDLGPLVHGLNGENGVFFPSFYGRNRVVRVLRVQKEYFVKR